ncbi:MAG TPA: LLM class flavin-dependent oxidoreductase [Trebonia sp.]|nr:LLM class flavin-dependent oxidoreductase [Trebonia sp.]
MNSHLRPKPLGVALSGGHLAALLADRRLAGRLDASGLAFAVAGIDRIDGAAPGSATVESTIAIATLAARAPRLGWLAAAAVHRDHPYNLARRVASADHLSDGRTGLVIGAIDGYAPDSGAGAWGGAGLTPGAPLGLPTTLDAASAIRELWLSWPSSSIVADRATGIYARGEQIVHIDHRGVFNIEGPLTVPTTPQVAPVLAWYARSSGEVTAARAVADVLIVPPGLLPAAGNGPGGATPRLLAEVPAGDDRLTGYLADDQVAGVILRPPAGDQALDEFFREVLPLLAAAGAVHAGWTGTLRERLSLAAPPPLAAGRPAFPAPVPRTTHA